MVKIVSIEANIGAGKSTLISNILKKVNGNSKFLLVPEPVDKWMNIKDSNGDNILEAFYKNKQKVSLSFQLIALFTRMELIVQKIKEAEEIEKQTGKEVILITERTIKSDYHIFAKMLSDSGDICEHGILAYKMWNEKFDKEIVVSKFLYINIPPEICQKRIKRRSRNGEENIDIKYLEHCHSFHEIFYKDVLSKLDTKVIDTTLCEPGTDDYDELVEDVINFFT